MAQRKNEHGLTPKQEAFCHAYVNAYGTEDFGNATAALLKAYNYKNRETAYREASRLMNDPQITTRLNELLLEKLCEADANAQALIDRDRIAANFDDALLWAPDPETGRDMKINITKLPKWIRVLGTWKTVGGRAVFVVDKEAARERLHKALIKTKVEADVNLGFDDLII